MPVKGYVVPDMPAAAHRLWAKEMMLDTIDRHLHEHPEASFWDPHDQDALRRERNRIAKMFGLPEKGWGSSRASRRSSRSRSTTPVTTRRGRPTELGAMVFDDILRAAAFLFLCYAAWQLLVPKW